MMPVVICFVVFINLMNYILLLLDKFLTPSAYMLPRPWVMCRY